MRRIMLALCLLVVAGGLGFAVVTRPRPLAPDAMAGLEGDARRGEQVFWAGGCSSCHAAADATGDSKLSLGGGQEFPSP